MHKALLGLLVAGAASAAEAQVFPGPYPNTAVSAGGRLTWYVGALDIRGRKFGEMDAICQSVPVPQVSGWRAPTMAELHTLFQPVERTNAVARWIELYSWDETSLVPSVPPFLYGARSHPQVSLISRDVQNFNGGLTELRRVERGKMYILHWYNRWTQPFWTGHQTIRHNPADFTLGSSYRLLCVSERAP